MLILSFSLWFYMLKLLACVTLSSELLHAVLVQKINTTVVYGLVFIIFVLKIVSGTAEQ